MLSRKEKAFIDFVEEEGYSVIKINIHNDNLAKADILKEMVRNAEVEYYDIKWWYGFVAFAVGGGFVISLYVKY